MIFVGKCVIFATTAVRNQRLCPIFVFCALPREFLKVTEPRVHPGAFLSRYCSIKIQPSLSFSLPGLCFTTLFHSPSCVSCAFNVISRELLYIKLLRRIYRETSSFRVCDSRTAALYIVLRIFCLPASQHQSVFIFIYTQESESVCVDV